MTTILKHSQLFWITINNIKQLSTILTHCRLFSTILNHSQTLPKIKSNSKPFSNIFKHSQPLTFLLKFLVDRIVVTERLEDATLPQKIAFKPTPPPKKQPATPEAIRLAKLLLAADSDTQSKQIVLTDFPKNIYFRFASFSLTGAHTETPTTDSAQVNEEQTPARSPTADAPHCYQLPPKKRKSSTISLDLSNIVLQQDRLRH